MTEPNEPRGGAAPMPPERWAHVRALVEAVVSLPRDARSAFLDASCGADAALRDRVERLAAACDRATEGWAFLARPAGELVGPLVTGGDRALDSERPTDGAPASFISALADRYVVGPELGRGGMATVYVADDLRHQRRVAIKVLDRRVGVLLGAQRFLAEIRVTAGLQHPNLLPLFDSGEAGGLLYYVMPLIDGATLRARLDRERQLPVDEAIRIVRVVAGGLDYAHRQGIVHRDLKPENILLQDGQPLISDFGISLAVTSAAGVRSTGAGISLGTPEYMSPEQAAGDPAVDRRSDIYSLACVLYESLVGHPPFSGKTVEVVIAKVLGETPPSVHTLRPSVPSYVAVAITRALAKLPADRFATAHEFADALAAAPTPAAAPVSASSGRRRNPIRLVLAAAVTIAVVTSAWLGTRAPAPVVSRFVMSDLIDQTLGSTITMTPDGQALVYSGRASDGRALTLRPLAQRPERVLAGTEGAFQPAVSPDGGRIAFFAKSGAFTTTPSGDAPTRDGLLTRIRRRVLGSPTPWRYGSDAWDGDSAIVTDMRAPWLSLVDPRRGTLIPLTDTAAREAKHAAPLLLPGTRAVVFTVRHAGGPGVVNGPLAIASLDRGPDSVSAHTMLGLTARRAIAFVDGWLLFITVDGTEIRAVRLDVARRRTAGSAISVLKDPAGNLETGSLADNGTLLYVRRPRTNSAVFVDSTGAVRPLFASTDGSFMYPRVSPDGKRIAVQLSSANDDRRDVWLYDVASRTPTRLTTTGQALHPTWTPDGGRVVFLTAGSREIASQRGDGGGIPEKVLGTRNSFAPTVSGDLVVFHRGLPSAIDASVWSASLSGASPPQKAVADPFNSYEPAVSPDGKWLAYTSNASGRPEVYARPFLGPGLAVRISDGGGTEAAWSRDGLRVYYRAKRAFMETVVSMPARTVAAPRKLFEDSFAGVMQHRNYDVAPDGSGFFMIAQEHPDAVVLPNWVTALRDSLARAR